MDRVRGLSSGDSQNVSLQAPVMHDFSKTAHSYVSNPNEWSALVLAATASATQAPVLFDFIDQYLKFETSISVDPHVGFSFHFQFLKFMCTSDKF